MHICDLKEAYASITSIRPGCVPPHVDIDSGLLIIFKVHSFTADHLLNRRRRVELERENEELLIATEVASSRRRQAEGHIDVLSESHPREGDGDVNIIADRVRRRREESLLLQESRASLEFNPLDKALLPAPSSLGSSHGTPGRSLGTLDEENEARYVAVIASSKSSSYDGIQHSLKGWKHGARQAGVPVYRGLPTGGAPPPGGGGQSAGPPAVPARIAESLLAYVDARVLESVTDSDLCSRYAPPSPALFSHYCLMATYSPPSHSLSVCTMMMTIILLSLSLSPMAPLMFSHGTPSVWICH